ncbi:hypothetical protein GOODEAATRI_003369 [Goodea atripinnis]|uniref:Fibronectin type-III domain-containing protein n=1 Tax=Goodea atripinnis TaxID=208336 RepID=A0ABV0PKT7_9TELE
MTSTYVLMTCFMRACLTSSVSPIIKFALTNCVSTEYVIEFEDQGLKERGWEELKRVGGNQEHAVLSLWPYMSYRFRAIAINEKMDKRNFNGPDFKYKVQEAESTVEETGPNEEMKVISNLRPYSRYLLSIAVFNKKGEGPHSEPLPFNTEEGVTESDDSPLQKDEIDNPTVTHFTLKGLDRHNQYRFYLRGLTSAGKGEPIIMTGATTLDGGGSNWKKSEKVNSSQSFYQLRGLTPGSDYVLRFFYGNASFWETGIKTEGTVKDKEDGPMDSEARPMKEETFGEYSDLEEKRTASQPSLCEDNKMCSEDTLNFNGSSALTTELNLDESLASQISRQSEGPEGFHGMPENSPLNPTTIAPTTNGMPNSITILD